MDRQRLVATQPVLPLGRTMLACAHGPTFEPLTMDAVADRLRIEPYTAQTPCRFETPLLRPGWIVDGGPSWEWSNVKRWAPEAEVR